MFQVRETSHKPDEIYGLIERLSPGTRKLELFGRMHNAQKNWFVAFYQSAVILRLTGTTWGNLWPFTATCSIQVGPCFLCV